jgi:Lrp/AsnC family leucine-responsive transcriptional regulator
MKFNETDIKILRLVQQKDMCLPRTSALAKQLNVPVSTIHERLQKMKEKGIIKGYAGLINGKVAGYDFVSFLIGNVRFNVGGTVVKKLEKTGESLAELPFIQEVYYTSGQTDVICKLRCKDKHDYYDKGKKAAADFEERGWGTITTKTFKDTPKFQIEKLPETSEFRFKDIDLKLLNMVQNVDMCVPRTTKIAKTLGLPPSTVHEKLKRFKEEGVIDGYAGLVDGDRIGYDFVVFVLGQLQLPKLKEEKLYFENAGELVSKLPFVQEAFFIAGNWDIICKMRVRDKDDYYEKVKKVVEHFDVRGEGVITTRCFKDMPTIDL